jgi:hypothetical protein
LKRARVVGWAALSVLFLLIVWLAAFRQRPGELVTIRVIDAETRQPLKFFRARILQRTKSLPVTLTLHATNGELRTPLGFVPNYFYIEVKATNHAEVLLFLGEPGEQHFEGLTGSIGKTNLIVIPLPRSRNNPGTNNNPAGSSSN